MPADRKARRPTSKLPLSDAERRLILDLIRDRPDASNRQVANIFRARAGRPISRAVVWRARRGEYDAAPRHRLLTADEKAILAMVIRENLHECNWTEMADAFAGLAGRTIAPANVARYAVKIGVTRNAAARDGARGPGRRGLSDRRESAHAAKLADAPFRPGYHARTYRGPDGGPAGDSARVYRATTSGREGS